MDEGKALALKVAENLTTESREAASHAANFEAQGKRDQAFRALGIAEGLISAASRVRELAREL